MTADTDSQLEELQSLLQQSDSTLASLLKLTTENQKIFREDAAALQLSHDEMDSIQQILHEQLDERVVNLRLDELNQRIANCWTSNRINNVIQEFLQTHQQLMLDLQEQTNSYRQSMHTLYSRFQKHHGTGLIQPKPYSLQPALLEFETIMKNAVDFDGSFKLFSRSTDELKSDFQNRIGTPCQVLFETVRQDVTQWLDKSLQPLDFQLADQRQLLGSQLDDLKDLTSSRATLSAQVKQLEENSTLDAQR